MRRFLVGKYYELVDDDPEPVKAPLQVYEPESRYEDTKLLDATGQKIYRVTPTVKLGFHSR